MFVFLLLFLPVVCFPQDSIVIPRYSIVYISTNNTSNSISEIYFDHQKKLYLTNFFQKNHQDNSSILNNTQSTPITINSSITYQSTSKKHTSPSQKGWKRPSKSNYRLYTLQRSHLSNNSIFFQTNHNGTVLKGLWYDHFTDTYFTNTKQIQIDHIVPFKEAFRSQKTPWTSVQIQQFYSSPLYSALLPVYSSENNKKSDSPPSTYLPPNKKFQAIYIDMWIHTKEFYNLRISSDINAF